MENDFLNVSKTKNLSKSKDTKLLKANKSRLKKKQNESNNIKYKSIIPSTKPKVSINNDQKYNININPNFLSSIYDFNFDNNISPPELREEQILNFNNYTNPIFGFNELNIKMHSNSKKSEKVSSLSLNESKFLINDMQQSLYNNVDNIIKIQSHFRGYEVKKKFLINYLSRAYITKKSIQKIINIQKIVRSFLAKINIRKKIIINLINQKRKKAVEIIIKKMRDYLSIIKTKKSILINHFLEERKLKAIFIQESFRNYLFYKSFKKLRESIEKNYFLDYPFNAKKVDILLYSDTGAIVKKKYKKFSFVFNELLKYFILLINPNNIFSGKYKCQFVVNDIIICDNRYPTLKRKNQIFNIIYLIPKNKKIKYKIKTKHKNHSLSESYNTNNIININININHEDEKIEEDKNEIIKTQYYNHSLKKSLEEIMEEEDEGKSVTSSSRDIKYEKIISEKSGKSPKLSIDEESDDDDDFDYAYEELLKSKYKKKKD